MSTDKSLKHLKSKDKFLIANVSNYFWKHSGTANHILNRLFRQLGSAEELFSEYEKNYKKQCAGVLHPPPSASDHK